MIFVTSWDDGHPLDIRIAELLDRYDLSGSFYIPIRNQEGREVMNKEDIRLLDSNFDIGSHTLDHIFLDTLPSEQCYDQIRLGKDTLEDYVGHDVKGFCYPGGKYNASIIKMLKELDITHARTVANFSLEPHSDNLSGNFEIPTTLQFYPHKKLVYYSNYIKQLNYSKRYPAFKTMIFSKVWLNSLCSLFEKHADSDKIFHIWGHSWEIDEQNLWGELESFLKFVSSFRPQSLNVSELNHSCYQS